jgi:hypothetical protein
MTKSNYLSFWGESFYHQTPPTTTEHRQTPSTPKSTRTKQINKWNIFIKSDMSVVIPPLYEWGLYCNHLVRPSVHTFVTDISASTGRNDFIFDIWLWHGDLYRVSPFQVYRTSTSCLQCDLEFFMFAVMKTFVTVISASTGRNDFIFDIWLWHGDLYRVSPFQVYHTSTSCLPSDLQMNEWGYS